MTDDLAAHARLAAAARTLRRAEAGGPRPADLPEAERPVSEAEAYHLQDLVIGTAAVAGWKVAAMPGPRPFSAAPLAAHRLVADGAPFARGDRAPEIEVEIAIRIARDLPPRPTPYAEAEVLAALGPAHAAFEIIESRFADRKAADRLSTLADAQSSRAFGIGSGNEDWQRLDLTRLAVSLSADEVPVAQTSGNATVAQTIAALVWLANHAAARGHGLRAGQFVITGARIGPLPLPAGASVTAAVAGIGAVTLHPV